MTPLAFDVESLRLASEVEAEYPQELGDASPWSRPDLFGFACGVIVAVDSGEAWRFGSDGASDMVAALSVADTTVGYNSAAFDLGVLGGCGDVSAIRERHVDLCAEVREALDDLPETQIPNVDHLRSGGLDALARANGFEGKTGSGEDAVTLFREGRLREFIDYCEQDARLTAALYRIGRDRGTLKVEAYYRNGRDERCYLPMPVFVQLAL